MREIFILISFFTFFSLFLTNFAYAWWDYSWVKRFDISINNTLNSNDLIDYQINLIIDTNSLILTGEMQPSCADIRFTYYNATSGTEVEIPHWVESGCNSTNSSIWVKIPFIRNNSYETIYMYYGNPSATSGSSPKNVFTIFDDFNSDTLEGWNYSYSKSDVGCEGPVSVNISILESSYLYISYSVRCPCKGVTAYVYPSVLQNISNLKYSLRYNFGEDPHNNGAESGGVLYRANSSFCGYTAYQYTWPGGPERMEISACGIGVISNTIYQSLSGNTFYRLSGITFNDFHSFTIGDVSVSGVDNNYTNGLFIIYVNQYNSGCDYSGWVKIDDIKVQKYTQPEPSYIITLKEETPVLSLPISTTETLSNQSFSINLLVYYYNTPLTNLTQENFQLFIDNKSLPIINFANLNNGTYLLTTTIPYNILGDYQLKAKVNYQNRSTENSTQVFISIPIKQKILFISDNNWKNILSLAPIESPIIISNTIDTNILHFINSYQPEQIFLLGNIDGNVTDYETYKISSFSSIPTLFFNSTQGIYAGKEKQKATLASLLASLLNKPLIFSPNGALPEYNLSLNSTEEIENLYLQKVKEQNKNINYLVLSDGNTSLDAITASQKTGFIIQTNSTDPNEILQAINEAIGKLNSYGFYINNPSYLLDGAYLLILGNITPVTKEDPVEKGKFLGIWTFSDDLDGTNFPTFLDYGDLDNDTYLDIAVGRLPNDDKIASLMFARTFLEDNKKALVASEYLHTNWFTILLYMGGGMWQGRTISKILEDQNYNVTKLVEHRANPMEFLASLAPVNVQDFLDQSKQIGEKVGKLLGKAIGTVVYKVLIVLRGLQYAEQALEMYLEYDWSTFGPKYENAIEYLQTLEQSQNLTQANVLQLLYILWPYPWEDLSEANLIKYIPESSIIYYEGIGNGTDWILPNAVPSDTGFLGWREFLLNNQYNGSESLPFTSVPNHSSRIVWDNSDLAANSKMKESFLERGSTSYIGASAINYAPFSAEIDSRFFKHGDSIGMSLIDAVNDFRDDWLTWDPFNVIRPGIKSKTLREFILFGDPSLKKDPITEKQNFTKSVECNDICKLDINIPVVYKLMRTENETTIIVDTENYLLDLARPVIPLKEFEYFLPFRAIINTIEVSSSNITYQNISLPRLDLLSHSLTNLTNESVSTEWYPEQTYRLSTNSTIDNRTRVKLVHAAIVYNESNRTAIVFDTINLSIRYTTPLEFSIDTSDINESQTGRINITIWSNYTSDATLHLKISNGTYSEIIQRNVSVNEGKNTLSVDYQPESIGAYMVEGILFTEDVRVGPRISVFKVLDTSPPKWSNVQISPTDIDSNSSYVTMNVTWNDNIEIDKVFLHYKFNESGDYGAYSSKEMKYLGDGIYSINLSYNFSEYAGKTFWLYFVANDTSNNTNQTNEFYDYIEGPAELGTYKITAAFGNASLINISNFTSVTNIFHGTLSYSSDFGGEGALNLFGFVEVKRQFCFKFFNYCIDFIDKQPVKVNIILKEVDNCPYFLVDKIYCIGRGQISIKNEKTKYHINDTIDTFRINILNGKTANFEGLKGSNYIFKVLNMRVLAFIKPKIR